MEREVHDELVRILPQLRKWAFRYAIREYDADDLLTDTIVDLLEHPDKYRPDRGPLRNFLFSAIKNRAWDFLRNYNRTYKKQFRKDLKIQAKILFEDTLRSPRVHDGIDEAKTVVLSELDRMSNWMQTAFRMYAVDGKNYREIALEIGMTPENVKSMVHRAKVRLRECLSA